MIISCDDFNLEATMDSGQVFGFSKTDAGSYEGVLDGRAVRFSKKGDTLSVGGAFTSNRIRDYFDLDHDLTTVYETLSAEEKLAPVLGSLKGLRLIRQNSWEALAGFILSSNNNVKRIQRIWRDLSVYFSGRRGSAVISFPSAGEIASSHERILRGLGLGYRAPFLLRTAHFVSRNPESLEVIRATDYEDALRRVLAFPGIGPKVADCVLLYGFQKYEAFPVDVWILRVMRSLYFRGRRVSERTVHAYARRRWGGHAGYVQQYLFHGARTKILV